MITPQSARMLTRYNQWANHLIFEAVAALPEGEAIKPRPSLFKNMVHTLNHNYVIDLIWQAHLEGRDHGFTARNTPGHPSLDELRRKQQAIDDWYIAWSDGLSEAALAERVRFTLIGGNPGVMTRGEILLHIVNHTTYHRGFVADLMYQVPGARPPTTDLPVYLRETAAAPAQAPV
ncbi:MAG TPA: DinB family protein [Burkholderiales bacterium]|nr:DinB family protein [Burkholderiales bacterium]